MVNLWVHDSKDTTRELAQKELTHLLDGESGVSSMAKRGLASGAPEIGAMEENQKNIIQISKLIDKLEVMGYNRDSFALKHSLNEVLQGKASNASVLREEIYDIKQELVL